MIKAGQDEAESLLAKWLEERSLLEVRLEFLGCCTARFRGRLSEISPAIRFFGDSTELAFRMTQNMEYFFDDVGHVPSPARFGGELVFLLRELPDGNKDFIALMEVLG